MISKRREFFKNITKPLHSTKDEAILRPPYGFDESLFQSKCIECEEKSCATYCEEGIIVIKSDGTPTLNFKKSGCTFCQECALACKKGVLSLENKNETINALFQIDFKSCLSHQGTICFSCKEPCLDDAILFTGMFKPVIDETLCTNCGFCISKCPTNAISYKITKLKGETNEP